MKALVIGATGATGKDLLSLLVKDESFTHIDVFARRDLSIRHEKLKVHIIDFDTPEDWRHLVRGDVLFSCLGTTIKAANSKENQWKVDYGYQYSFAKAAKDNGVPRYVLVSSDYASPTSRSFYSRMKGQLEQAVTNLQFRYSTIIQPPILIRTGSDRPLEKAGVHFVKFMNKMKLFNSKRPMPTSILAQAMANSAKVPAPDHAPLTGEAIWQRAIDVKIE